MDLRTKRIIAISGIIFAIVIAASLVFFFLTPKNPSTQYSEKTVIIDNYADYTTYISSDSFGYLGNYLYEFIVNPDKEVYHAVITEGSYTYDANSWFSKFVVQLKDSDIAWNISMQTLKNGEINADIGITCKSGGDACLELSDKMQSQTALQDLLPLNSDDYIINYQTDHYDRLSIVYYDLEGTGKTKALDKIKSLGFNPDDYIIEYYYGGNS